MASKSNSIKTHKTPRIMIGELASTGLKVSDGRVYEESVDELRWPQSVSTYNKMSYDASVASAHNAIKAMIRTIKWKVYSPEGSTDSEAEVKRVFIEQCMNDMDTTWGEFINDSLSIILHGHSVHEKVFKYRNGENGKTPSNFNDGRLGWAKLPIRSQDTIYRWLFDNNARNIIGIEQDLSHLDARYGTQFTNSRVTIPRKKFLHFTHDAQRGNPEGTSPLRACYVPWKYKVTMEEIEAIGASRDMRGMPVIELPPEYMASDADPDKVAVYQWAKDTINNIHNNEQAGLVLPKYIDPDTKANIFGFRLEGVTGQGGKSFDTNKIIERYENKILMTYLADVLKLGQDASGSFALSDNKNNLLAIGIQSILTQILEVINKDLIQQTMKLNGWKTEDGSPYIGYDDLDERNLEVLGGFIQKCVSVGAMEVDQALSDSLKEVARLPKGDDKLPMREKLLPTQAQTKAGEGQKTAGEGTAKSPSGKSNSTANASKNTN